MTAGADTPRPSARLSSEQGAPSVVPEPPTFKEKVAAFWSGDTLARPHVGHVEALGTVDPERDVVWKGYVNPPGPRLGVCCSGGGIRSAAFNLGALQELRRAGLLARSDRGGAEYLSAVSGGAYISVAHIVTAGVTEDKSLFSEAMPPWAPGSPEERHLRNHSMYLASGVTGKTWFVANLLLGLATNLVPFALAIFVTARPLGWVYAELLHPGLRLEPGQRVGFATVNGARWLLALAPILLGFVLMAVRRLLDRFRDPPGAALRLLRRLAPPAFLVGLAWAFVVVLLPLLVVGLRELSAEQTFLDGFRNFMRDRLSIELPELNVWALLVELVGLGTAAAAAYRAHRGLGRRLLPLAARVAGPLILLVPFVNWVNGGAAAGFRGWGWDTGWWLLAGLTLLGLGFFGHNARWSMHLFYREQLSSAFVLGRQRTRDRIEAVEPPYERPVLFSQLEMPDQDSPARMPRLVVCATANVSDDVVPPGRRGDSFTFTGEESGGPLTGWVDTSFYEGGAGASLITLPTMMAISGAAISPSMGKMTRVSTRFLFTLFNVRLGVWVANPLKIESFRARERRTGVVGSLIRGWKEPGPLYLLYEALGWNTLDRDFLYVTDGGHWENLGLVELLRRGCTEVLCFDAAGDALDTFNTIGEAMALARSELRVEIELDLDDLRIDPATGSSRRDHVTGRIRYPDGTEGVLVFAKAAMPIDAPWDVRAFRERDPRFPCHSTGDQLFDDEQFQAYWALGAHAGKGAARTLVADRDGPPTRGRCRAGRLGTARKLREQRGDARLRFGETTGACGPSA